MNIERKIVLGLDIGGTEIKAIALETPDKILSKFDTPSGAKQNPQSVLAAINRCLDYFNKTKIAYSRVGIGCAGSVDVKKGIVRNSPNFSDWKNVPLGKWTEKDCGKSVSVNNDAKCAVYAEWKVGAAIGTENAILLTLGTGIGGGLILNNKLYYGSTGTAGELGHFSIQADGIPCPCGNRGCFERYCSASALLEKAPNHTAKEIFENATLPQFSGLVRTFIDQFQIGLTGLANVFDPEIILLGGALSQGLVPYLGEIEQWIRTHAFPAVGEKIKIRTTQHQNLSGAIGAALLAVTE